MRVCVSKRMKRIERKGMDLLFQLVTDSSCLYVAFVVTHVRNKHTHTHTALQYNTTQYSTVQYEI